MEIIEEGKVKNLQIEVGDLIIYKGKECLVGYDREDNDYPYPIIEIRTGYILDKFIKLKYVNNRYNLKCKNEDMKLILKEAYNENN